MKVDADLRTCQRTGEVRQRLPFTDVWLSFAFAPGDSGIATLALRRVRFKNRLSSFAACSIFLWGGCFSAVCLFLFPHLDISVFRNLFFRWYFSGCLMAVCFFLCKCGASVSAESNSCKRWNQHLSNVECLSGGSASTISDSSKVLWSFFFSCGEAVGSQ